MEECSHVPGPVFCNQRPFILRVEKFVYRLEPKIYPSAKVHFIYGIVDHFVNLHMGMHRISKVFAFKEKIGLPKIGQELQVGLPILNDSIKYRPQKVVFSDFSVKSSYQKGNILP